MDDIDLWYNTNRERLWAQRFLNVPHAIGLKHNRSTGELDKLKEESSSHNQHKNVLELLLPPRSRSPGPPADSASSSLSLSQWSAPPRPRSCSPEPRQFTHKLQKNSHSTLHLPVPSRPNIMKKSDAKPTTYKKKKSPLLAKRSLPGAETSTPTNSGKTRTPESSQMGLSMIDAHHTTEDGADVSETCPTIIATSTNGGSSEAMLDESDGTQHVEVDVQRTKAAIEHLNAKIIRTMDMIKTEQGAKEENVNEYLQLASSADKQQIQRIKTVFEKKNQKSTQGIATLQKKLENYHRKLKEVETYGVTGHKQPKEVLRDMGQGLKGVGANIRDGISGFSGGVVGNIKGAKETIVSKPREFAHLIKNKFGSADNINNLTGEDGQGSDEIERSHHGSGTLPASFKYVSDDETSSVTSGSGPSGAQSSPHPQSHQHQSEKALNTLVQHQLQQQQQQQQQQQFLPNPPTIDLEPFISQLSDHREVQERLREAHAELKDQIQRDYESLKQIIEEDRYRYERLEEQINDMTELHQHEVTNIKQELSSMEEKMEYQLDERTNDVHEMLESCQTRISKMELQAQQQQLISMEGVDNANARALITKLINVVLALLAVILVFVSTVANLLAPFLYTRLRILSTTALIALIIATWKNWTFIEELGHDFYTRYNHIFPVK